MKKIIAIMATMCAAVSYCDNQYNSALGSFALDEATNCEWNISIGAASMMGATNTSKSVFLGNRAGQGTYGVTNCVGIGWGALRNKRFAERATDINGQFLADKSADTVEMYSNPNALPVASYSNGLWRLNGDLIIEGSVAVSNHVFYANALTVRYDFYVDAMNGDDQNDGRSALTPKRTLDAALNLVTNDTSLVCVRAGRYAYPEYFKKGVGAGSGGAGTRTAHNVELVGVDGADNTIIENESDSPAWVSGYPEKMMILRGLTFTGFNGSNISSGTYSEYVCAFTFVHFIDCVFRNTDTNVNRYKASESIFEQCVFENCKMYDCNFTARTRGPSAYYWSIVFDMCLVYNSDMRFSSIRVSNDDYECAATVATEWIDSYLEVDTSKIQPRIDWNGYGSSFSDGKIYNSTLLIGNITGDGLRGTEYYDTIFGYGGSGVVGNAYTSFSDCYTNTASNVDGLLGTYDRKPLAQSIRSIPLLGFCGWKNDAAISVKNGIVSFLADAITDSIPPQASEETATALRSVATRLLSSPPQEPASDRYESAISQVAGASLALDRAADEEGD